MKVTHVSPTWFGDGSVVGGAERYALELARACARLTPTSLLSFARRGERRREGDLELRILRNLPGSSPTLAGNPLHPSFYAAVAQSDVVHCHQVDTAISNAAIAAGALLRKRVFVSDLGGGHRFAPSLKLPVLPRATGLLLLSEYSRGLWEEAPEWRRPPRMDVIYGGVDIDRFRPAAGVTPAQVLFAGRLVRHKGVEHAIAAVGSDIPLVIAGRPYDPPYVDMLRGMVSANVEFRHDVDDDGLITLFGSSVATVVPSVYETWGGGTTRVPELFGLVALESMACGTPVIVSKVASLPELVEDGVTGFVVPPNDPRAIRLALDVLRADPARRAEMGRRARLAVEQRFTWEAVARRCLEAYRA